MGENEEISKKMTSHHEEEDKSVENVYSSK
jgi:hypothetical protein